MHSFGRHWFCWRSTSRAGAVYAQAMKITTADVAYDQGNAKVKGYLARPADKKARPALILIHEWWGLNDNIRENARQFAELGYVALAVDLYNGEAATAPDGARRLAGGVRKDPEAAFANLKQAVSYLSGLKGEVDPTRIASVGWCFGGGWSYQMAQERSRRQGIGDLLRPVQPQGRPQPDARHDTGALRREGPRHQSGRCA